MGILWAHNAVEVARKESTPESNLEGHVESTIESIQESTLESTIESIQESTLESTLVSIIEIILDSRENSGITQRTWRSVAERHFSLDSMMIIHP